MQSTQHFFSQLEQPTATVDIFDIQHEDQMGETQSYTHGDVSYNSFSSIKDFENNLTELYKKMGHEIIEKLKMPDNKLNKLLFLKEIKDRIKNLNRTIIATDGEMEWYHHNNLVVKNISTVYPYSEETTVSHVWCKEYLQVSKKFIGDTNDHIASLIDFVLKLDEKDISFIVPSSSTKLKVNLSVDDLSALFKILFEDNLITPDNKTDVGKFISEHFETKKTKNISEDSANNKFHSPETKSLDFWYKKCLELRSIIQDLQQR